jgi:hypothetical protein
VPNELPARWVRALSRARTTGLRAIAIVALVVAAPLAALAAGGAPAGIRAGHARRGVSRALAEIARGSKNRPPSASRSKSTHPASRTAVSGDTPSLFLQFDGLSFNDNLPFYEDVFPPPDPSGAAGPNHYVQAIKLVFRVFDKDGNPLLGPLPTASLWTELGGVCATEAASSPQVRYDQLADRWVIAQSAYDTSDASVHECFAVSQTSDPTGSYFVYDFPLGESAQAGSARLAMWPDGYYVTVNQIEGFDPAGIGVYAFDRAAMLAGDLAGSVYANPGADGSLAQWGLAADFEGLDLPPSNAPGGSVPAPSNVIAAIGHPDLDGSPTPRIHLWYFHPDFVTPPNSTLTGPIDVDQDDFNVLDCGSPSQGCVPQLNSNQLLQATPNRLMSRMPYRSFGDHDAVVAAFTVGTDAGQAAPRWFELRDLFATPFLNQQGTFVPDSSNRFVPSVDMTQTGVIALAYNKSDATIHPSLGWTFHLPGDPSGTMQDENVFFEGPNSQPPVVGFWGSYSSLSLDATDQCTLWFTAEYTGDPSPLFERTRVAVLTPFCGDVFGGALEGTVTDSASGLPIPNAHVHVSLGADTTTDPTGHYQFLELPPGTYDVTVTKYAYIPATATGVVIQSEQLTTQDFALAPAPQALLNGVVRDGSGGGWPLYARVTISGPGFGSTELHTDPVTGYYGITLVAGVSYTLSTRGRPPGLSARPESRPSPGLRREPARRRPEHRADDGRHDVRRAGLRARRERPVRALRRRRGAARLAGRQRRRRRGLDHPGDRRSVRPLRRQRHGRERRLRARQQPLRGRGPRGRAADHRFRRCVGALERPGALRAGAQRTVPAGGRERRGGRLDGRRRQLDERAPPERVRPRSEHAVGRRHGARGGAARRARALPLLQRVRRVVVAGGRRDRRTDDLHRAARRARRRERVRREHGCWTERHTRRARAGPDHALLRDAGRPGAARRPLRPLLAEREPDAHGDPAAVRAGVEDGDGRAERGPASRLPPRGRPSRREPAADLRPRRSRRSRHAHARHDELGLLRRGIRARRAERSRGRLQRHGRAFRGGRPPGPRLSCGFPPDARTPRRRAASARCPFARRVRSPPGTS